MNPGNNSMPQNLSVEVFEMAAQQKYNRPFHTLSHPEIDVIVEELTKPPPNLGFEIDLSYEPENERPIITLNDKKVLSIGNLMGVVSKSGTGKSQLCEAIISRWVDPEADAFGFSLQHPDNRNTCLYVDTERSRNDSHRGFMRIVRRINERYIQDNKIKNLIYRSFKGIPTVEERQTAIESIIKNYPVGLMIIDGITDLMLSVNDEDKAIQLLNWLTALIDTNDLATLLTIHSSPSSAEDKPRGHIGSEIYRRSESMWKLTSDKDIKILQTDFSFGKVRNDYNLLETYFTWDDETKMFISCDYTPEAHKKKIDYRQIFSDAFGSDLILSYSELVNRIIDAEDVSLRTAKRRINDGLEMQRIIKDANNNYRQVS